MSDKNLTTNNLPYKQIRNLQGQRFGRLQVLEYAGNSPTYKQSIAQWKCLCDCGTMKNIVGAQLTKGSVQSCGCFARDSSRIRGWKHGESCKSGNTPEYRAYYGAKERCESSASKNYENYGGRGIEFRFTSYEEFLTEVGRRPSSKHSLDRIDVDGHYEKGNLRWATSKEQSRNRRKHREIIAFGETLILAVWAERFNLPRVTITSRLELGWCNECAVSLPVGAKCIHH